MYQELIIIIYYLQNNTDGYANPDADLTLKGQRVKRTIWNQLGQRESQIYKIKNALLENNRFNPV